MVIIFLSKRVLCNHHKDRLRVDGILLIPVLPESDRDVKDSGNLVSVFAGVYKVQPTFL